MSEDTIESLARRVTSLERQVAQLRGVIPATRDLNSVVGMFKGSEFMKQVDAEIVVMRAEEQKAIDDGANE